MVYIKIVIITLVAVFQLGCNAKYGAKREVEILPTYKIVNLNVKRVNKALNEQSRQAYVYPKVNRDGEYWAPQTIAQLLDELNSELTKDIKSYILSKFVRDSDNFRIQENNSEFLWNFTNYLYEIWELDSGFIYDKLQCIGVFERNLSALYVIFAYRYAKENNLQLKDAFLEDAIKLNEKLNLCE